MKALMNNGNDSKQSAAERTRGWVWGTPMDKVVDRARARGWELSTVDADGAEHVRWENAEKVRFDKTRGKLEVWTGGVWDVWEPDPSWNAVVTDPVERRKHACVRGRWVTIEGSAGDLRARGGPKRAWRRGW